MYISRVDVACGGKSNLIQTVIGDKEKVCQVNKKTS